MKLEPDARTPRRSGVRPRPNARHVRHVSALIGALGLTVSVACGPRTPTQVVQRTVPPPPASGDTGAVDTAVAFDLRFKGVGVLSSDSGFIGSALDDRMGQGFANASGTPLSIGTGICSPNQAGFDCFWFFESFYLPPADTGLYTTYRSDFLSSLPTYLDTTAATDTVITSLDLEPADSIFALAEYSTTQTASYTLTRHLVAPAGLQAAAAQEAAHSRVITALSFLGGQVMYLSYGSRRDSTTGYDAQVSMAAVDSVPAAVQALAASGYTITALGGDSADGMVVVGTRVHGVTTPRATQINTGPLPPPIAGLKGYAVVGYVLGNSGTGTLIGEK
jgi:Mor family transcriptional regulator